jgi:hypothetical protein
MPEFVMEGRDLAARMESDFALGFIEALFWVETSPAFDSEEWFSDECRAAREAGTADGELPGDVGYTDLHPDSLAAIRADCEAWQAEHADLLESAYATGYTENQAGIDYYLTRNGHGAGFWDRGLGDLGDRLSDACRGSEVHAWFGDHVTYGDAPFVHVDL